jgi:rare lipoprotein A
MTENCTINLTYGMNYALTRWILSILSAPSMKKPPLKNALFVIAATVAVLIPLRVSDGVPTPAFQPVVPQARSASIVEHFPLKAQPAAIQRAPLDEPVESAKPVSVQTGVASWYGEPQRTASGERFNPNELTAAHRRLPLGTRVRVTNLKNSRSTVVRINDRGPYIKGRILDLSKAAARELAMINAGTTKVRVEVLPPASDRVAL